MVNSKELIFESMSNVLALNAAIAKVYEPGISTGGFTEGTVNSKRRVSLTSKSAGRFIPDANGDIIEFHNGA